MKKLGFALPILLLALALASTLQAQQVLSTQFTEFFNTPPPAILNSTSTSTATNTGVLVSSSGGTIAAGTYRIAVTFFTLQNTETTGSIDTAATAVVTTTGSTSTLTVIAPVSAGLNGSNVVGYRVYIGASGGAAAAETLQTPAAANCTLSASTTPSCALTSNFVITTSTNFVGGGGAPATSTALTPPLSNAANTALFENAQNQYRTLNWIVSGTAPGTCTVQLQTGTAPGTLANVGQAITCTGSGAYELPLITTANYLAANLSAFTPGDTTTRVTFYVSSSPYGIPVGVVNTVPSGNCSNGFTMINTAAASASTVVYVCQPANTFTAITVP